MVIEIAVGDRDMKRPKICLSKNSVRTAVVLILEIL
jgi:hypothetical protein